jgi:hypothetical protein
MSGTEAVQYITGPMWTINGGREPSRDLVAAGKRREALGYSVGRGQRAAVGFLQRTSQG